ncbi:GNAT family N-acetyltransferase [Ferrimonas balearica]|uniref:GNAT family N-acetyltransferase n=1 Tax=Ferrimonas balearica TaxID=44012 RepID=UPI001C9990ED|nr:GNAT family N-acetyltransferase [Ferrimonas balearica]MBY5993227.1 GNAT family N-acetyltransferase [Ferrimonas balearica]
MTLKNTLNGQALPLSHSHHLTLMQPADLPAYAALLNDPKVHQFLFFAPASEAVIAQYLLPRLSAEAQAQAPVLALRDPAGRFLGMVALAQSDAPGVLELGFQLSPECWGQGLATAAARQLLAIAFDQLGAGEVKADCYDSNRASKRVLEKSGLGRTVKEYGHFENGTVDRCWFALTEAQYRRSEAVARDAQLRRAPVAA